MLRQVICAVALLLSANISYAVRYEEAAKNFSIKNYELSLDQFMELSSLGNKDAQYAVASHYLNGYGTPQNHLKAYAWFKLASTKGDKDAAMNASTICTAMTSAQKTKGDNEYLQLENTFGDAVVEEKIYLVSHEAPNEGEEVTNTFPIRVYQPAYPRNAANFGMSGDVILEFVVGKDGRTKSHSLVSYTHKYFIRPAFDAAKKIIFRPALKNGKPIEMHSVQYRYIFKMADSDPDQKVAYKKLAELKEKAVKGSSVDRFAYARALPVLTRYIAPENKSEFEGEGENKWLTMAAVDGLPQAKFVLGTAALYGKRCNVNESKSTFWLDSAADDGLQEAKVVLAESKFASKDEKIIQEGLDLLKEASDANDSMGQLKYSLALAMPPSGIEADVDAATRLIGEINEKKFIDLVSLYEARYLIYTKAKKEKLAKKSLKALKKQVKKLDLPWKIFEANLQRMLDNVEVVPLIIE